MARGTIHPQKPDAARRAKSPGRPNAGPAQIELPRDSKLRGPTLKALTGRDEWDERVARWYDTWRQAPQAAAFESTDWRRMETLAYLYEAFYRRPGAAAMSEIRMNEERLGATVTDRQRARMVIESRDSEALAPVAPITAASRMEALRSRRSE